MKINRLTLCIRILISKNEQDATLVFPHFFFEISERQWLRKMFCRDSLNLCNILNVNSARVTFTDLPQFTVYMHLVYCIEKVNIPTVIISCISFKIPFYNISMRSVAKISHLFSVYHIK